MLGKENRSANILRHTTVKRSESAERMVVDVENKTTGPKMELFIVSPVSLSLSDLPKKQGFCNLPNNIMCFILYLCVITKIKLSFAEMVKK